MQHRVSRSLSLIGYALFVALAVGWFLLARPTVLGGEASYLKVSGQSMLPGLRTGDLALVRRDRGYEIGDVVGFRVPPPQPAAGSIIIHRIVALDAGGYRTRGDNSPADDPWRIYGTDILGEMVLSIPRAGIAFDVLGTPAILAAVIGGLTVVIVLTAEPIGRRPRQRADG
jgi:signal peptidase I